MFSVLVGMDQKNTYAVNSAPRSGWLEQHNAPWGPTTASAMEGEVREVHDVLREQKPPLPGMRPAPLSEVAGPLGRLVVPAFGGVPALVPVVMVQEAAHDDATVSYLFSQLADQEAKKVEEFEAKLADREQRLLMSCGELRGRFDLRDQFTRLLTQVIGWAGIKWEIDNNKGKKRKMKKRRKRKLPKTSSSRLRPCARSVHTWKPGHISYGRCWVRQWIYVYIYIYSYVSLDGPGCSASWPLWNRRTVLFVRSSSFLAVACARLVLLVLRRVVCSLVGMDQKDIYAVRGFTGDDAPRAVLLFLVVASWPVWIRRTVASRSAEKLGFTGRWLHYVSVYSAILRLQWYT